MSGTATANRNSAAGPVDDRNRGVANLKRGLVAYSAAGAALLGASQPAAGAIIYTDFPDATAGPDSQPFLLDLDGNGLADFTFAPEILTAGQGTGVAIPSGGGGRIPYNPAPNKNPAAGGRLRAAAAYFSFPTYPFPPIPSSGAFLVLTRGQPIDDRWGFNSFGFAPYGGTAGFLGLRIAIEGQMHFGWARIGDADGTRITLYDAAYESRPGVGIAAGAVPEPGSLGLLATGAAGLALWRRRGPATARRAE